jgi:hypothetical protein
MGQSYRMRVDLDQKTLILALRTPASNGAWARTWREKTIQMPVPDLVAARAKAGKMQAPSLREIVEADGTRYAVLDFIVEVPVEKQATFEEMHTVLGFDWGIRVLAQVRGQEQRPRAPGSQHAAGALHCLWLPTDCRRVAQIAEIRRARTWSKRALEKLENQYPGARSLVADLAV